MAVISLKKISALPISLRKGDVIFGKSIKKPELEIKSYKKYKAFFKNPRLDKNKKMYYIYRNSCLKKDLSVFKRNGLRYDITAIFPGSIGEEPVRTIGHVHKSLAKIGQPAEIYQVIYGTALFILHDTKTNTIHRIERRAGQKIVIPGNCAHITANRSDKKPLIIANIFVNKKNVSDYGFFKKTNGPAWYPIRKGFIIVFKKNLKAGKDVKLAPFSKKCSLPKEISRTAPLYKEFVSEPNKFIFLSRPDKYRKVVTAKKFF
jgi:glucose-6-phosphate isomerase